MPTYLTISSYILSLIKLSNIIMQLHHAVNKVSAQWHLMVKYWEIIQVYNTCNTLNWLNAPCKICNQNTGTEVETWVVSHLEVWNINSSNLYIYVLEGLDKIICSTIMSKLVVYTYYSTCTYTELICLHMWLPTPCLKLLHVAKYFRQYDMSYMHKLLYS